MTKKKTSPDNTLPIILNIQKPWYSMTAKADEAALDVFIFGEIGWEVEAAVFARDLASIPKGTALNVRINSRGGDVHDGLTIYNALLEWSGDVAVVVQGLAASMGSVIAMAGDTVEAFPASMLMIHNPRGLGFGESDDMRRDADTLDSARELMISAYSRRGVDEARVRSWMDAETWFTAQEALDAGLIDGLIDTDADMQTAAYNSTALRAVASLGWTPPSKGATKTDEPDLETTTMPDIIEPAGDDAKVARNEERERQRTIRAEYGRYPQHAELMNSCLDNGVEIAESRRLLLEALGNRDDIEPNGGASTGANTGTRFEVTEDARAKFREGVTVALAHRAMITDSAERKEFQSRAGNEFSGWSLADIAERSLELQGIQASSEFGRGASGRHRMFAAAFSQPGSDFPGILENIANKAVLRGYELREEPYEQLARIGSLTDFKTSNRSGLSFAPSLPENRENMEVENIHLADRGQSIALATYAGRIGLSRKALIDDDLNEFSRMAQRAGDAAKQTVGDQFANVFTVHVDGATIDEGSARIFASARSNTGTGGAISTTTLQELRSLAALQQGPGSVGNLNIDLNFLYTPVAIADTAMEVVASQFKADATAADATRANTERNRWTVVKDPRLDRSGLAGAAARYYGLADPDRNDTIEVAFLDGNDQPQIEQQMTTDILGIEWVVWIDCTAQALDYRGMTVNDGS